MCWDVLLQRKFFDIFYIFINKKNIFLIVGICLINIIKYCLERLYLIRHQIYNKMNYLLNLSYLIIAVIYLTNLKF